MKMAALICLALACLVVVLGGAFTSSEQDNAAPVPAGVEVTTGPVAPTLTDPEPGCSVPDPTGTGGCITPATAWVLLQIRATMGDLPTSCWDAHTWNPTSDHPAGRACDVFYGRAGTFPGPDDTAAGWRLATWLRGNAAGLNIRYVIWQGRIWSASRDAQGWRTYTGGGVYDARSATGGHYDHVHFSTTT